MADLRDSPPAYSWLYWLDRDTFDASDAGRWESPARDVLDAALDRTRHARAFAAGLIEPGSAKSREILEAVVASGRSRASSLTAMVGTSARGVWDWFGAFFRDVAVRATAGTMGLLGVRNLPDPVRGSVAESVAEQKRFLSRFRDQIRDGVVEPGKAIAHRATLYADAVWGLAHRALIVRMRLAGYREAKRLLHGEHHCGPCLTLAALGWVPIGEVVPPGKLTPCRVRCKCTLAFRKGPGTLPVDRTGRSQAGPPTRGHRRAELVS